MLSVNNLSLAVGEKEILDQVSLDFVLGKNYCVLGRNGSGKSSLAMAIMGHPNYEITHGDVLLDGESLLEMEPNERAKLGIFLAFQNVPEIPGIKFFEFLKGVYDNAHDTVTTFLGFKALIEPILDELQISKEFLWRDLNVGFSGGERRKFEILQMKLLKPKYIILDEIDSGLDVDAFKVVAGLVSELDSPENSFIIITHIFSILDHLPVDEVIVMKEGRVAQTGDKSLVETIKVEGFGE
ncbi:MAG: Fe-S cluster assembly ATPase SufC [Candidatus Absconditabacteria bacterium]|nr:Fe-S cluster assembly ATPase SufC [Candidatus Absconditabacteria bacterium]MDD3868383.1 Fe-S cluster assembly ATPase SufC [Candidatus Absconditabacteria bacterium]MDD4714466.1 Fe-S cluster assembly ATPase SufC [Candidatus Absconditabacteria bacterium]